MIDPIINAKLNKLLDAGGYSKTKNETILAEVVLAENPEAPGVTVYQGSDKLGLVVGKTYTVHLDSGSYKTVCKDFGGGLLLGNGAIVGSDSFASDESFAVGEMGADGQSMCIIVDANNGKTASVSAITETIVPIDQKYLGDYEKKMLYDGTPTKLDLSAAGMGCAYLLSEKDLFSLAYGQNVHFEYTLANGTKAHGVLAEYGYMAELSVPIVYGAFTLLYAPTLGGTGVSFNYADIGEITNLKLWTEYSENKPYYVTGYSGARTEFIPVELKKAKAAAFAMRLMVRYLDAGGNFNYYIPTVASDTGDLVITITIGNITVTNGLVSAGW